MLRTKCLLPALAYFQMSLPFGKCENTKERLLVNTQVCTSQFTNALKWIMWTCDKVLPLSLLYLQCCYFTVRWDILKLSWIPLSKIQFWRKLVVLESPFFIYTNHFYMIKAVDITGGLSHFVGTTWNYTVGLFTRYTHRPHTNRILNFLFDSAIRPLIIIYYIDT